VDLNQRVGQICYERQGGVSDWEIIAWTYVPRAGEFEHRVLTLLSQYAVNKTYVKNGSIQMATELLRCSFSRVYDVFVQIKGTGANPWRSPRRRLYEFS
jgi:hypothetical protein